MTSMGGGGHCQGTHGTPRQEHGGPRKQAWMETGRACDASCRREHSSVSNLMILAHTTQKVYELAIPYSWHHDLATVSPALAFSYQRSCDGKDDSWEEEALSRAGLGIVPARVVRSVRFNNARP